MSRWMRSIAAAAAALSLSACGAAPPSTPQLPADAPVVAFYGDSYTLGTGASDPAQRWSTRICADRGWREFNPSVNGLGFVARREGVDLPGQIIAEHPDIVIVTMGLNDAYSFNYIPGGIREQIDADVDRLSTELPDARLIVVEPFWYTAERPESLDTVIGWVKDAAARVGADYIPGASSWIQGRPGEMASDGLHPNDTGYDLMTRDMDEALRGLGL